MPQCSPAFLISASDHDERIPLFTRAAESDPELPYAPLLRYGPTCHITILLRLSRTLETQDDFVQLKAAQILTVLLWSVDVQLPVTPILTVRLVPNLRCFNHPSCIHSSPLSPLLSKAALRTSLILQSNVWRRSLLVLSAGKPSGKFLESLQGLFQLPSLYPALTSSLDSLRSSSTSQARK